MVQDVPAIRNVAVIAHVDHGKTTLIDALLKQTHVFRDNEQEMNQERILDTNDLERERGITILAKICAIHHRGVKINIIDTPGHADFSGEVERTLGMADGALLIIDAQEGPMPQTRFVLRKALELNLKIIVVINKIDKQYARIPYVLEKTENLFLDLVSQEKQLDFGVLYAIGREGKVFTEPPSASAQPGDTQPLLDAIIDLVPSPRVDIDRPFKMMVSSIDYDPHLDRIAIGRIHQGLARVGTKIVAADKPQQFFSIEKVFISEGLAKKETAEVGAGDIVSLAGIREIKIGQTIGEPADASPLPAIIIGEPTMHLTLGPNTSPFSGQEGQFTTSRQLENRIERELEKNLSLRVAKQPDGKFTISGRGELHLAIFLENIRREGYEMEVEKPEVILKEIDGKRCEPVEEVDIIVPKEYAGVITQELGKRFGEMTDMEPINEKEVEFVYRLPTRALIGLRSLLLTATKGTVLFTSQFLAYEPAGKPIPKVRTGVLIASDSGEVLSYGLHAAQQRGITFVPPGTIVYEGMIIGQNAKDEDITVNVCKGKKLTNMRSKSSDGIIQLTPPTILSLEQSLDFLEKDELLEITPRSLRLRKKQLTELDRRRAARGQKLPIA